MVVVGVNEPLQASHAFLNVVGGRWHEGRVAGARASDPVLGSPELAGRHCGPPPGRKQPGVHLPHETIRKREATSQALDAVIQGRDGVRRFQDIVDGGTGRAPASCSIRSASDDWVPSI